ncbi:MAG TPA: alpha-L-rhamnosidase C-terminal domain-containing protein, partial [Humibacillus sp.]|nr:alpha-L-rhamnosidase C-terminal domain-containing protein [Humibacillus sp.]
ARWATLSGQARAAWQTEFVEPDGTVLPDTQANLVRALDFQLVPDEHRQRTADRLAELLRSNGTHLATGFLATPRLLPVLADAGHLALAYEVLLQDTAPSWLAMTERGATTLWERWEGVDADGVPHESLNHYSKGAVIGFLHGYVAGLRRTTSTWRRFRVEPRPGGGVTWASAEHETPHGRAAVSWQVRADGALHVEVTVPPGCVADVVLPSGTQVAGPGTSSWSAPASL